MSFDAVASYASNSQTAAFIIMLSCSVTLTFSGICTADAENTLKKSHFQSLVKFICLMVKIKMGKFYLCRNADSAADSNLF